MPHGTKIYSFLRKKTYAYYATFDLQVVISRGLQLEGQVVTEEQDLQVIVMTMQKTTPIQYLYASAMQKRVQNAVAQSQASCFSTNVH